MRPASVQVHVDIGGAWGKVGGMKLRLTEWVLRSPLQMYSLQDAGVRGGGEDRPRVWHKSSPSNCLYKAEKETACVCVCACVRVCVCVRAHLVSSRGMRCYVVCVSV